MPLYDYDCAACGRRFEVIHGLDAPPPSSCPRCGSGPVRKAFAPPTIVFKGSGWAKKERRAAVKAGGKRSEDGGEASPAADAAVTDGRSPGQATPKGSPGATDSTTSTGGSAPPSPSTSTPSGD